MYRVPLGLLGQGVLEPIMIMLPRLPRSAHAQVTPHFPPMRARAPERESYDELTKTSFRSVFPS
jgi:hypothetical protein